MANGDQILIRHEVRSPAGVAALTEYAKAVGKLKERPLSEPSSWWYQAAIHGTEDRPLQPLWRQCEHQSWYFLPWHRMYLYYFEGIVRKAVIEGGGPEDWALPYWNYGLGGENAVLPPPFREASPNNPLWVDNRRPGVNEGKPLLERATSDVKALARPDFIGVAEFGGGEGPPAEERFWGQAGVVENTPHNAVHGEIGGLMNNPETAAQDPIFWLHHANIDRIWALWNAGEDRTDPEKAEWLDKKFEFFRADGQKVAKACSEVRNTVTDLNYNYDPLPASIVEELVPPPPPPPPPSAPAPPEEPKFVGASEEKVPLEGESIRVPVEIDPRAREEVLEAADPEDPRRLYLNVEDIQGDSNPGTVYGIYLNLPESPDPADLDRCYLANLSFFGIEKAAAPPGDKHPHGMRVSVEVGGRIKELRDKTDWGREQLEVSFRPLGEDSLDDYTQESHEPIHIGRVSLSIDS
jgi:tyrosinase